MSGRTGSTPWRGNIAPRARPRRCSIRRPSPSSACPAPTPRRFCPGSPPTTCARPTARSSTRRCSTTRAGSKPTSRSSVMRRIVSRWSPEPDSQRTTSTGSGLRSLRARMRRFSTSRLQTAVLAIMGPKSREILQPLTRDDLSNAAFPFATAREPHRRRRAGARVAHHLCRRARLRAACPGRIRRQPL